MTELHMEDAQRLGEVANKAIAVLNDYYTEAYIIGRERGRMDMLEGVGYPTLAIIKSIFGDNEFTENSEDIEDKFVDIVEHCECPKDIIMAYLLVLGKKENLRHME